MSPITYPPAIFDEVFDFLVSTPTPEQIIAFKPSPEIDERLGDLLAKNKDGRLTAADHEELEAFQQMDHFMTMLKIRARQKLAKNE